MTPELELEVTERLVVQRRRCETACRISGMLSILLKNVREVGTG